MDTKQTQKKVNIVAELIMGPRLAKFYLCGENAPYFLTAITSNDFSPAFTGCLSNKSRSQIYGFLVIPGGIEVY